MSTISVKCDFCGKQFEKRKSEYNRRMRLGKTKLFCSYSCSSKRPENIAHIKKNASNYEISNHANNRLDSLSSFRYYMKSMKNKGRKPIIDVDASYLKEIWESQKGICPFSGVKMTLRTHTNVIKGGNNIPTSPYIASVDRIDNDKGYEKGNIRFISLMANYARNNFSDKQLVDFCKAVVYYEKH
jgi:hypothetical protein